jgi:hypothetical protein
MFQRRRLARVVRSRSGKWVLGAVALFVVVALTWFAAVATVTSPSGRAGAPAAVPGGAPGAARYGGLETVPAPAGSDSAMAPKSMVAMPSQGAERIGPVQPPGPVDVSGAVQDRSIVRTARLAVTVADLPRVVAKVRAAVSGVGGFVASEQSEDTLSTFTLKVPAPALEGLMGQLAGTGQVTARSEQADDVTDQVADLQGRLETEQASVNRVRALMAQASSVGDVVTIEDELTQREADLDSLQKRLASVSGQVAMSTLTVELTPAPGARPAGHGGFLGGLAAGWHALGVASGALLAAIGMALPFLVLIAVLGGLALLGRRIVRRRRSAPPAAVEGGPASGLL